MMLFITGLDILLVKKNGLTYIFSHKNAKIKVNSYDSLPLEETLTFHNVIIFIKSVFNKDQNQYYCNIFLEKCSYAWYKYKHCMNMLCYDRTESSEGIDINKTIASKNMKIAIIDIFKTKRLSFNQMSTMGVMMY